MNILNESNLCTMCNEKRDGGLNILGTYICRKCEEDMISDDLTQMRVQYYKDRIKSMWKDYKPS